MKIVLQMGLFNRKKTKSLFPDQIDKPNTGNILTPDQIQKIINNLYSGGGSLSWETNSFKNLKNYLEVPELNTALNIYVKMFSSCKVEIVSKLTKEPISNRENLVKILRAPNYFQTFEEYMAQGRLYRFIDGNQFEYFRGGTPGMPSSVDKIFTIPPWEIMIQDSDQFTPFFLKENPQITTAYYFTGNGKSNILSSDSILHLSDTNISRFQSEFMRGKSCLDSVAINLQNIRAAYESRHIMIVRRGALGILSPTGGDAMGRSLGIDPEDKEAIQQEYKRYGTLANQNSIIISPIELKYQEMGIDPRKLMLFEEVEEDTIKVCDVIAPGLGKLLSTRKDTTFDNQKQYKKSIYENSVMPDVYNFCSNLNDQLGVYKNNQSWYIRPNFSHLKIFEEDKTAKAQTLLTATNAMNALLAGGLVTIDEAKTELTKYGYGEGN